MKVELHINGKFAERWFYDDIRAKDYSEDEILKCKDRIDNLIEQIKIELNGQLGDCVYVFYIIYQSNFNTWNYSETDINKFNREINKAS